MREVGACCDAPMRVPHSTWHRRFIGTAAKDLATIEVVHDCAHLDQRPEVLRRPSDQVDHGFGAQQERVLVVQWRVARAVSAADLQLAHELDGCRDRCNVTTPTPGSGYETQLKLESSRNSPICC